MKTIKDLKKAYQKALRNKQDIIEIEGFKLVTGYAKYLIQLLKLRKIPDNTPLKAILKQNKF